MRSFIGTLRTLLVLGRVSNLPTVWSNLIVGWILADGPRIGLVRVDYHGPNETLGPLLSVLFGGSFLYVGGMYLNDFCDADFDARYCQNRPIPSGKISRRAVGFLAALWFTAGLTCFTSFGPVTIGIALLLIVTIVAYDIRHKNVAWAPLLMGICRCLLYLLSFSAFGESWYFNTVYGEWWYDIADYLRGDCWSNTLDAIKFLPVALPLGLYVVGITYLARGESRPRSPNRWALILLLLPIAFACSTYANLNLPIPVLPVILICLLQLYWMAWLLIPLWRKTRPSIGRVVSGLLAGIVLVDMIALIPLVGPLGIVLFPLFVLALLLQRIIPAT